MDLKQKITLPATVSSLPKFRAFVAHVCQHLSIDDQTTYDVQLAIDEALSNIIEHGYAGLPPGDVLLSWKHEEDQLVLQIIDFGKPFVPRRPQDPDVEAQLEMGTQGGLGLFFIYQIMDAVSYQTGDGQNTLTLSKKL